MNKTILIATKNEGKARDFRALLEPLGFQVQTMADVAADLDVAETGSTFEENAILKAQALADRLQQTVIADDSGLAVDALGGAPGVYSARYAGEPSDDEANNDKLLHALEEVPDDRRTARFCCALAVASPGRSPKTYFATCEGKIARARKGAFGFGYDPLFVLEGDGRHLAELPVEEKGKVSHRGRALRLLEADLPSLTALVDQNND